MRIFKRLRERIRSESDIERRLFEAVTGDLLRKLENETSIPVLTESKANCCSCCSAEETGFRSRLHLTIATSNSAMSARPGSTRCASRAGASPASGTMSGWMRRCSSIQRTGEAGARGSLFGCGLAGLELAEQRRKDLLCLADLWNGLGLIDVAGISDHDHPDHSHAVVR